MSSTEQRLFFDWKNATAKIPTPEKDVSLPTVTPDSVKTPRESC